MLFVCHNKTFDQVSAFVCDSTTVTLSDLKNYCSCNYSELENAISTAESKDKITSLLKKKNAFPYLYQFQALSSTMGLKEVSDNIEQYEAKQRITYTTVLVQNFSHQDDCFDNEVKILHKLSLLHSSFSCINCVYLYSLILRYIGTKIEPHSVTLKTFKEEHLDFT